MTMLLGISLIYLVGIFSQIDLSNSIKLNLIENDNQFRMHYTSELTIDTPYNPNYTYYQTRKEEMLFTITVMTKDVYTVRLQTTRFASNTSESNQTARMFDSDTNPTEKETNPLFNTIVEFAIDDDGQIIEEMTFTNIKSGDLTPDYTKPIALHLFLTMYEVNRDIKITNLPKKWNVLLPLPREKGYNETFNVLFHPNAKKRSKKQSKRMKSSLKPNEITIPIVKGRFENTDSDDTIMDAKLTGYINVDTGNGIITLLKLYSNRDVDDPKMGFHRLKEEMTLEMIKIDKEHEITTPGKQPQSEESAKNEL